MRTRLFPVAAALLFVPAIATAAPPDGASAPARPSTQPLTQPATQRKKPPKPKVAPAAAGNGEKVDKSAKPKRTANAAAASKPPSTCMKPPIEIAALTEIERFTLARCDATPAPLAVEHLSVAMRAGGIAKPKEPLSELAKIKGDKLAPGIRRADPGLVVRLQKVIDHFGAYAKKPPPKVMLVSGYRPASHGSKHAEARALDFKLEGVSNEELVAFCKTLDDTGCGYYPNSTFVHMDVRDPGAGHVTWIDASGPGETPRYVTTWPPPKGSADRDGSPSPLTPARDEPAERFEDPDSLPALPMPDLDRTLDTALERRGDNPGPFTR